MNTLKLDKFSTTTLVVSIVLANILASIAFYALMADIMVAASWWMAVYGVIMTACISVTFWCAFKLFQMHRLALTHLMHSLLS
jgi:hypothetical protein